MNKSGSIKIEDIDNLQIKTQSTTECMLEDILVILRTMSCNQKKQLQILQSQAIKNSILYTQVHDATSLLLNLVESNYK